MSYLVFILFAIYWLIILIKKKVNFNCSFAFCIDWLNLDIILGSNEKTHFIIYASQQKKGIY